MPKGFHPVGYYTGFPGAGIEELDQQLKDAKKDGNRRQRRAWAKQQGKPMPRKGEGEDE